MTELLNTSLANLNKDRIDGLSADSRERSAIEAVRAPAKPTQSLGSNASSAPEVDTSVSPEIGRRIAELASDRPILLENRFLRPGSPKTVVGSFRAQKTGDGYSVDVMLINHEVCTLRHREDDPAGPASACLLKINRPESSARDPRVGTVIQKPDIEGMSSSLTAGDDGVVRKPNHPVQIRYHFELKNEGGNLQVSDARRLLTSLGARSTEPKFEDDLMDSTGRIPTTAHVLSAEKKRLAEFTMGIDANPATPTPGRRLEVLVRALDDYTPESRTNTAQR